MSKQSPTMQDQIALQAIKDKGSIDTLEELMLCQKIHPLYVQLYERAVLEDEYGIDTDCDLEGVERVGDKDAEVKYIMSLEDEEMHEDKESIYEFSIDALQMLAVVTQSCKGIWMDKLIK